MVRISKRFEVANNHSGLCTPYAEEFLAKEHEVAADCVFLRSTNGMYEVSRSGCSFKVNLDRRTCSCRKFDISGIPCEHAYAAIIFKNQPPTPSMLGRPKKDKKKKEVNESPTKKQQKLRRIMHCRVCGAPNHNSRFHNSNREYTRNVRNLTEKILGYLSKGLGLQREALIEGLGGDSTEYVLRINHYPLSDSVIGAPKHTDFCGLALLVSNDVPGLQVFNDNHWFDVEFINSSAVVVLIGDQIMRMSNGRYKNVVHRSTMEKEKTRMTWPVLVEPKRGLVVGPLPELTGDENPPKFESLTFQDYVCGAIKLRGG